MSKEYTEELNRESALENGRDLAFPFSTRYEHHKGLTKREYMASQIMSGLVSGGNDIDYSVELAVQAVDKLLIRLHKNSKI